MAIASSSSNILSIYVVGTQCTGKTTLVNDLADYFAAQDCSRLPQPHIVDEVARQILKTFRFPPNEIRDNPIASLDLQQTILSYQYKAEMRAASKPTWFISDRSGLDPLVYATMYCPPGSAEMMAQSDKYRWMKARMQKALVIVCEAGMDWWDHDQHRLMALDTKEWLSMHKLFCLMLEKEGVEYVVLPFGVSGRRERVDFVVDQWKRMQRGQHDKLI